MDSIVEYFNSGIKPYSDFRLGLEIEHLVVDNQTQIGLQYSQSSANQHLAVEEILRQLVANFSGKYRVVSTNGQHILALECDNASITLEPGAQLEVAVAPQKTGHEIKRKYNEVRDDILAITNSNGATLVNCGYQLVTKAEDVVIIPKPRYAVMDQYLATTGQYGLNMMRCSASTQISIDYVSEADAYNKLRISTLLGPLLCYYFSNTPYFEGEPNSNRLMRMQMWDNLDPLRCSSFFTHTENVNADNFFREYAHYALNTPLMVVDYSQTPEFTGSDPVQLAARETGCELYPDRALNTFEIEHILSTYFFDSRLKNYVELRACDSFPIDTAVEYLNLVERNFYNGDKFDELVQYFSEVDDAQVVNVKHKLINEQLDDIYGRSFEQWLEILN
jgi:glutamate--cysteine ligase